ncbi:hypothetical protein B7P43_G16190, partial [Cryptotermes secundus]
MGTLTWTVWLLLAFTALAINVEVGAAPEYETGVAGGKQHSGQNPGYGDGGKGGDDDGDDHDDGGRQGHGHKKELSKNQKNILQKILKYLKLRLENAKGEIEFDGHRISIDFILTAVNINGGNIEKVKVKDLWEIIQLYEIYEKKLESEPQNRNISKDEQVTLLYAITYLRKHKDVTGDIVIDGVKIPVTYVLNQLKKHGQDIRNVTIEQLYKIIDAYISKYIPTPSPLGKQPTEEQKIELRAIIDFLKAQGSNAVGSFILSGHRISVRFILNYLAQHGLNVKNLTAQELWRIIHAYVNETDKLNKLPAKEKTDLRKILKYLKFLGEGATGEIAFNGTRISVDFILT